MKEAIVGPGLDLQIVDSPIPEPNADQVVIKVVVSGSNPKDWKVMGFLKKSLNSGDDIAGIVHKVGANVFEFKPGDRVAALHEPGSPHGSYAEYAVGWAGMTFHLPKTTSFEEAAAIPLAAMTAAAGLYLHLNLPEPWRPSKATEPTPLVIYGASSAVGAYAVQFARRSNIHPLICVAGKSQAYVESLIDRSKGDTILDYRADDLAKSIEKAVGSCKLHYVFEAVSAENSYLDLMRALAPGGKIALILHPFEKTYTIREDIDHTFTDVRKAFHDSKDFGYVMSRYFSSGLQEGWLKPQPQKVVPGGLYGIREGLQNLKDGKASAFKYVFRIEETEGTEKA